MYSGLLMILLPLIAGYLIPLHRRQQLQLINRLLSLMIYVILFFMGISLAFIADISSNLLLILQYTAVFSLCILGANLLLLALLERHMQWHNTHKQENKQENLPSRLHMALEPLKLCGMVLSGFLLGLTQWQWLPFASKGSEYALIILLLLVGIQLRSSGMTLRQILLNRRGTTVAWVVTLASLAGGALAAQLMKLPPKVGLAMASGFGWYSLSGILITDAYGPVLGSVAFFNDLARELVAIMLIPTLVRHSSCSALGLCGATSMDITLPMLRRSSGLEMVPPAHRAWLSAELAGTRANSLVLLKNATGVEHDFDIPK